MPDTWRTPLVRLVGCVCRRARLLGQRGDLERPAGGSLEHVDRLLLRARVELDQEVDDDALLVVLVKTHVGEELPRSRLAERAEGEAVGGLGPRARLHLVLIDGDRAGGDERLSGHHPLPAVLHRDYATVL